MYRILKNYIYRKGILICIGVFCLLFGSTFFAKADVALDMQQDVHDRILAYLEGNDIVVKIEDESNNGEKIKNHTQIWGDYGKGWFLIKDYGNPQGEVDHTTFRWDLRSLDNENESYYWDGYRYKYQPTDMFKIYVRYKKKPNDNIYRELYKTFYLGGTKQDVQLYTSQEKWLYLPSGLDFPVVAYQNTPVELLLNTRGESEEYTVKILGYNDKTLDEEVIDKVNFNGYKTSKWTPKESGIFNIAVFDKEGTIVLRRKVYVNSNNKQYLQLEDMKVESKDNIVCVRLDVKDTRPTGFDEDISTDLKFTISEPHVWSKTIINYGDLVRKIEGTKDSYEVDESNEKFSLGFGNYRIVSFIKSANSIEYEDAMETYFRKEEAADIDLQLILIEAPEKYDEKAGIYKLHPDNKDMPNEPLKFAFEAVVGDGVDDSWKGDYQIAFFKYDARGKKCVQSYCDDNTYEFYPSDSGEYTIYARIRRKQQQERDKDIYDMLYLENSYEKEVSLPIVIEHPNMSMTISNVSINGNLLDDDNVKWKIEDGLAILDDKNRCVETIYAHKLNIIEIDPDSKGKAEDNKRMYKVYAHGVHDDSKEQGYGYYLGPYTYSNTIPFYPKSPGHYTLTIMVKDVISGSHEEKCEISIDIK